MALSTISKYFMSMVGVQSESQSQRVMGHVRRCGSIGLLCSVLTATLSWQADTAHGQVGNCDQSRSETYLDVNNVRARIFNNGHLFWRGNPTVYEVPKGSGKHSLDYMGFWVGGYKGEELRMATTWWGRSQYWSGPLDENGAPPSDCTEYDRLYNVYRIDIEEFEATGVATADLQDWPTGLGAPTLAPPNNGLDDDSDGEVDEVDEEILFDISVPFAERKDRVIDLAAGERPAILGDQSIWWVMNDRGNEHDGVDGSRTPPIGLEVHGMAYAFNVGGDVGNTTFYSYNLYLAGPTPLNRTYVAAFVNPNIGYSGDDWIGADTLRGMGFGWNSDNVDEYDFGYGVAPPALGVDFVQGPMVPSVGDTALVNGESVPNFKNLRMTRLRPELDWPIEYIERPNSLFYKYMLGRWWDGRPLTIGGNGRDFTSEPIAFMYPGDPGYSDAECQYWSQCNLDGAGLDYDPYSSRFIMSAGPFILEPAEMQQVTLAVVWAQGANNFDSVQELKKANDVVQALHDANYAVAAPPDAPDVTVTPMDRQVVLEWSNAVTSNNFLESFKVTDLAARPGNNDYLFEGYEIIQYADEHDQIGQTIAVYDVQNGVQRVVEAIPGEPLLQESATGTDSGVQTYHIESGLTNYQTYQFGVRAYAYNESSSPKVLRGPAARVEVVPTRTAGGVSELAVDAVTRGTGSEFIFEQQGFSDGLVTADVVVPISIQDATYSVVFYAADEVTHMHPAEPPDLLDPVLSEQLAEPAVTFDIKRDDAVAFDGSAVGQSLPNWPNTTMRVDGLQFSVASPEAGFNDFVVTANAAGWLEPPESAIIAGLGFPNPQGLDSGTIGRQQSSADVRWGLNAGGVDSGAYGQIASGTGFLGRALRLGGNKSALGSSDYEIRFTERCADGLNGTTEPTDCLALRPFGQSPAVMEVPFELWDTGVGTPNDRVDDVRMIPAICDTALCGGGAKDGIFDIGGDHPASGEPDDPVSDWMYFYRTEDMTPGESGYSAYWTHGGYLEEAMARIVLILQDGGAEPPYPLDLPEVGTIFRVETSKPIQPGDVFTASTLGFGAKSPSLSTERDRLKDIGIVPNPYKGASVYEVNKFKDEVRFTNLPDVAIIRVFTLNGTLIKTIRKQRPGIATISWDLTTDHDMPIASGLYLIHVEVPGVGETTFKFAVVKKQVHLNVF